MNSVMTNKILLMFIDTGHMFAISDYNKAPIQGYIVLLNDISCDSMIYLTRICVTYISTK